MRAMERTEVTWRRTQRWRKMKTVGNKNQMIQLETMTRTKMLWWKKRERKRKKSEKGKRRDVKMETQ